MEQGGGRGPIYWRRCIRFTARCGRFGPRLRGNRHRFGVRLGLCDHPSWRRNRGLYQPFDAVEPRPVGLQQAANGRAFLGEIDRLLRHTVGGHGLCGHAVGRRRFFDYRFFVFGPCPLRSGLRLFDLRLWWCRFRRQSVGPNVYYDGRRIGVDRVDRGCRRARVRSDDTGPRVRATCARNVNPGPTGAYDERIRLDRSGFFGASAGCDTACGEQGNQYKTIHPQPPRQSAASTHSKAFKSLKNVACRTYYCKMFAPRLELPELEYHRGNAPWTCGSRGERIYSAAKPDQDQLRPRGIRAYNQDARHHPSRRRLCPG